MPIENFQQLEVWKESHQLVLAVYAFSAKLPPDERFGLNSQMRRAAVSIPANIAEGFKRRSIKDKSHFYNIAQGSLEELRYFFILCRDLCHPIDYDGFASRADRVARLLGGPIRSLRS